MICYTEQSNQLKPAEGNSGASPFCVATLAGFFIGDTMKTCTKCHQEKELIEFHKRKDSLDGYRNQCINCIKARDRQRNKLPHRRELDKQRSKLPHRIKYHIEYNQKYRKIYPLRYIANTILGHAVQSGKIEKPKNCSMCGMETKIHGHHEDYYKPLDVIWLCQVCHKKKHL